MLQKIEKLEDVAEFIHNLVEEGVNAHPDEDFSQYINIETDEPIYTSDESNLRNRLINKSFDVCEEAGIDIYDLTQEIYLKETRLNEFIPLPSQKEFD
jgi:hypothetical protein